MSFMKRILIALLFASVLTACFGKFALTRKVYSFNSQIEDRYARSIVFWIIGVFIPVYGLAAFADFVVFNTLEFWTGNNPIESGRIGNQKSANAEAEAIRTTDANGNDILEFRFRTPEDTTILQVRREDASSLRMTAYSTRGATRTAVVQAEGASAEQVAELLSRPGVVDEMRPRSL